MTEQTEPRLLKRKIPPDLQKDVEDIQTKVPRTTGPPGDLDEEKKRWLIVGICLHSIISPLLRKYVDPIISHLYNSLVSSDSINTQEPHNYLKTFPVFPNPYYLNYASINNNRNLHKNNRNYDYKVTSHVDLSKLFLQPNMAHYSGINMSCDSSALLGLVINIHDIMVFPSSVQTDAEKMRSEIRNPWAHCDFREWTTGKYTDSFALMRQLVKDIRLSNTEENRILGELDIWATNGHHFLSGTTLGLEIVEKIHQQTHVLSRYVQTLCSASDSEFSRVQEELKRMENDLQHLQERMRNLESKTKEHDEILEKVKKQVEDHIPQHIRDNHGQDIAEWEQDQTSFLETRATRHIMESLLLSNCVVVTGSSGCGKSSNIHHAALHLRDGFGYEIIPVLTGPTNILDYYNEKKTQVFIVDDICGKETLNTQTLQTWRDNSEKLEKLFKVAEQFVGNKSEVAVSKVSGPKLLISCRLHIYKESQFQRIKLFLKKECNLLSSELCLLEAERIHMMQKYLPDDIINNVKQVKENVDYFPLLCKLSKDKASDQVKKLFTAPLDSIKTNITTIIDTNKHQFCALVLCIVFDDGFNTDWLKLGSISKRQTDKLKDIVKEFDIDLSKEMHRHSLKSGFLTLNGTYLKMRGIKYKMIHDKIYEMTAVICGRILTGCFINYAPPELIKDHFIFQSLAEVNEGDHSIVLLDDQEEDYFGRLLCDLKDKVIESTFNNYQLMSQKFRDRLILFLRRSDEAKIVLQKLDTEGYKKDNDPDEREKYHQYTTPLIESANSGYLDIVNFLIVNIQCNVNKTDSMNRSPLYVACKIGHSLLAKFLLKNNADVFQYELNQRSSLYIACKKGHRDTVKLLLQNNADVFQCDINGDSAMQVACKGGYTDIVELLLQNDADVSFCGNYDISPLQEACQGGHTDTVELLLQNNADVSHCDLGGDFPLYVASLEGYTDIVELLLKYDADVSQCKDYESSLFVACERGYLRIVELLLLNNADVSQYDFNGNSPLGEACGGGHINIVELLLRENVDVSNSGTESPLIRASKGGHTDIVKLLLQNKANVNECSFYMESPLYVACEGGHTDMVKLFLQNKADVYKIHNRDESSLYVACKGGYTDTVELLLQNDADVSKCDYRGCSPLYVACERRHTHTVELLLKNNADVSQCDNMGWSPLHAVCSVLHENSSMFARQKLFPQQKTIFETVKILLEWNANVMMRNKEGKTPIDIARESNYIELMNFLLETIKVNIS